MAWLLFAIMAMEGSLPRYDYECRNCHHVFEVKQSFSSEPVATCPKCMNGARRLIHAVPIVFKGSGFYVNDYAKGKSPGTTTDSKDSDDGSKTEAKSKGKSESKSESGSGSKSEAKKEPKAAK